MLRLERLKTALFGRRIESISLAQALEEEYQTQRGDLPYASPPTEAERLRALTKAVHALELPRTALCLSGGGIRSATFGLGILQGLARCGLLSKFDYLSTVSGGGYVGSWLSAWITRHPDGVAGVERELAQPTTCFLDPEPEPIRHLREYSNYLTPRLGFASADTWAVIATILRNLLLNWLLLIPLLSLFLLLPRWYLTFLRATPSRTAAYVTIAFAVLLAGAGISYVAADLPGIGDKRQSQRDFLKRCLLPLFLSAALTVTFWYSRAPHHESHVERYLLAGASLLLLALFLGSRSSRKRHPNEPPRRWRTRTLVIAGASTGAFGGLGTWYLAHHVFPNPQEMLAGYVCLAPTALLFLFCLVGTLFVGLTSKVTTDQDREWWSRAGGWFLLTATGWTAVSAIVIYGPDELPALLRPLTVAAGGAGGVITALLGYSAKTNAKRDAPKNGWDGAQKLLLTVAAPVFVISVLGVLSAFTTWILAHIQGRPTIPFNLGAVATADLWPMVVLTTGLAVLTLLTGWFVDVNKFSLHALYRNRLIRAYLGASHPDRDPNPFTGFDEDDDIGMHRLSPNGPLHVLNLTLNLVDDCRLAWQQRKAESFTVSRLHAGSLRLAYRPSKLYGEGISLGTAAATSGAAASPNMGYHSSPPITFLMALFNARLGWWLGNPSPAGGYTWREAGPRFAARPLLAEAFGLTNDTNSYVYLSDGGHFENLGLYEMVLRRCHLILVSDAGCDPTYSCGDLANAIRKIRIDLGIPITFDELRIGPPGTPRNAFCGLGTIHYDWIDPDAPDGYLVYLKPTLVGGEPTDVTTYHAEHRAFPHESTADQWFDEAQFESYRILGFHIGTEICGNVKGSLVDFRRQIEAYLKGASRKSRRVSRLQ